MYNYKYRYYMKNIYNKDLFREIMNYMINIYVS